MIRFIIASFFLAIVLAGVPGPVEDSAAGEEVLSRSKRVVGGTLAKINDRPWMASIQVHHSHYCGGTIISESVVLTTARCLVTERRSMKADTLNKLSVRVGSPNSENGGYVHRAVDLIAYDGFTDYSYRGKVRTYNDVALLKVEPPFKLGGDVQKISLAGKDYIATQGQVGSISGWGRTAQGSSKSPELRSASVRIANATECADIYADSLLDWSGLLCATASGTDQCKHDEGGPLVTHDGLQLGIISWNGGCADPNYPGVYTKLPVYRDWIDEKTRDFETRKTKMDLSFTDYLMLILAPVG